MGKTFLNSGMGALPQAPFKKRFKKVTPATFALNEWNQKLMERKYRYFPHRVSDYGKMPLLEVRLIHGNEYIDIDCLVDSGAADSMFSVDIADELGISLEESEEHDYEGIDGNVITGRISSLILEVRGLAHPIAIQAAFVEGNDIPILGQNGFFDNFEVRFQRYKGKFEIIPILEGSTDEYLM